MPTKEASAKRVRRRLEFRDLPYEGKAFYLDIKSRSLKESVALQIRELGGKLETFLCREIDRLITDRKIDTISTGSTSLHDHFPVVSKVDTPTTRKGVPLSRGRALLLKATGQSDSPATSVINKPNIADPIRNAAQWGVKIEHISSFVKKCNKLQNKDVKTTYRPSTRSTDRKSVIPVMIGKQYIKFEDVNLCYRPCVKHFNNLPFVNSDLVRGSPFQTGAGTTILTTHNQQTASTKPPKPVARGGYCESCDHHFTVTLHEHLSSDRHQEFANNQDNYADLDSVLSLMPNCKTFFSNFIKSSSNFVKVEQQKCDDMELNGDCAKGDNSLSANTKDDNPISSCVYEDGDNAYSSDATVDYTYPITSKANSCSDRRISATPGDQSMEVNKRSSTETTMLQRMMETWSIADKENSPISIDEQEISVNKNTQHEVNPLIPIENVLSQQPKWPIHDVCEYKIKRRVDKKSRRNIHGRRIINKECLYYSQQTSETKLRVCKVPRSPVQQKTNLKMFWKVRKAGECKLVFSATKRKRQIPISCSSESDTSELSGRYENLDYHKRRRVFVN